jgi:hypothetical protein
MTDANSGGLPPIDKSLLFKIGSKINVCGSSGSGKTYWLANYLMNVDTRFQQIIWITNELSAEQELIKTMKKKLGTKFVLKIGLTDEDGLKDDFFEAKDNKICTAVILDDLMLEQGKFTAELFIAGRHLNLTIFQLVQSIFTGSKQSRNMAQNVQYYILFTFPDKLSIVELARRLTTTKPDKEMVVSAWKDATSKKGGCLILDLITGQSDLEDSKLMKYRDTKMDYVYKSLADI